MIKTKISRVPVIESPCCGAPSTTMSRATAHIETNRNRRCVRCRQAFCRIDVPDNPEEPFKVTVGAAAGIT